MQGKSTLTQKNEPLLTQIQPKIDLTKKIMTLSATWQSKTCQIFLQNFEKSSSKVAKNMANNPGMITKLCSGKVCGDIIEGFDCGDEVADWLEETLGLTGTYLHSKLGYPGFGYMCGGNRVIPESWVFGSRKNSIE